MAKVILFVLTLCLSSFGWAARNLVLVPGFFNSAIPAPEKNGNPWAQPYFSQDIVKNLAKSGDRIWVVDNLNPVGDVVENGERLIRFLENHRNEFASNEIVLIGHSAGGLYSLYAIQHSSLNLNHLVTISTPFRGLKFLQTLVDRNIPLENLMAPFCLKNLLGLLDYQVTAFLRTIQIQKPLRLDVFGGYQSESFRVWDFRYLSAPLVIFQQIAGEPSDGIVTVSSSLDTSVLSQYSPKVQVVTHQELLPLEHWEQVADANIFNLIGVVNLGSLKEAQQKMFSNLLKTAGL